MNWSPVTCGWAGPLGPDGAPPGAGVGLNCACAAGSNPSPNAHAATASADFQALMGDTPSGNCAMPRRGQWYGFPMSTRGLLPAGTGFAAPDHACMTVAL